MHSQYKKGSDQQSKSNQPLILIIDDDTDNLLLASYVVESLGMAFVFTDKTEECLNLIDKLSPDIILLDIVMPKINGLELANTIKQDRNTSHIPIIAVTGLTRTQDIIKIKQAGCDAYICKPYLIEDLEFKLYSCLPSGLF